MRRIQRVVRGLVVATFGVVGACASEGGGETCGGTLVNDGSVCVMTGPITETGFDCPPEMPYEYGGQFDDGERWAMCSSMDGLDTEAIGDAMHEAGFEDTPSEPNQPDLPDDPDDPREPDDCREVDPRTGECLDEPEEPEDPGACRDEDADGICWDVDIDDTDAQLGVAQILEADGVLYVVTCADASCVGIELCMFVAVDAWDGETEIPEVVEVALEHCGDYAGGLLEHESQIDSSATTCAEDPQTGAEVCFEYPVPCRDDAGVITECEQCVDANSNRICDDEE